jgi:DNA-binding GntR family transcriptional regulator
MTSMMKLIEPICKRDQVVSAIKMAILAGEIEPGETIVESKTAQRLGVGIPLVREALIELEHAGYVQRIPYKGTTVTKLKRKDVERVFRLRGELEALAIEWAKENATAANLQELRAVIERMKRAARELDLEKFYENDLRFHRKIWEMADNPYLADALERIVAPLFAFFAMKTSRQRESHLEIAIAHEKVVEALTRMSVEEMRAVMKQSVAGWKDEMLNRLLPEDL